MIDVNNVVVSDRMLYNNRKQCRDIEGYQVDGKTIIPLFFKTTNNIVNYDVSHCDKNSVYKMSFIFSEVPECVLHYWNIWNEVNSQFESRVTVIRAYKRRRYISSSPSLSCGPSWIWSIRDIPSRFVIKKLTRVRSKTLYDPS